MKFVIRGAVLVGIGYGVGYVHGMKAGVATGQFLESIGEGLGDLVKEMARERETRETETPSTQHDVIEGDAAPQV